MVGLLLQVHGVHLAHDTLQENDARYMRCVRSRSRVHNVPGAHPFADPDRSGANKAECTLQIASFSEAGSETKAYVAKPHAGGRGAANRQRQGDLSQISHCNPKRYCAIGHNGQK